MSISGFIQRQCGRLICHILGSHEADWTWAHMTNTRPTCRYCRKVL